MNRNDLELCGHLSKFREAIKGMDETMSLRALAEKLSNAQAAARKAEWRCNEILSVERKT